MTWSVYQHWDPLKVCVVGRSYPPEFYSWISTPHIRALFERIAIETEEDYQHIISKLQEFGVGSNTSSMPEVVGNAAIQFDPYEVDSIANALEAVVTNSALQADLRQRGRDRLQAFSWDRCALETLNVYRKVLF